MKVPLLSGLSSKLKALCQEIEKNLQPLQSCKTEFIFLRILCIYNNTNEIVLLPSVLLLFTMVRVFVTGNLFVIAAILLERNLQSVANYLIVSLAVADLMVACLVMPLGAVYEVRN